MKYMYLAIMLVIVLNWNPFLSVNANQAQDVDNTGKNVRDINNENPTAENQSNKKSFVKTTARLRREIIRTRGLSINAQNVKIIDQNGCVTLRGPVDNEREKAIIDDLAHRCCGINVNNELEVKTQ